MSPLLALGERVYRSEVTRRNAAFDRGKGVTTFDRPVISVGNLSVGGTGKTPCVRWVVRSLRESGRRPVIAMRGYGAPRGERSDEQAEHEHALPGVPVVANPDRTAALISFFASSDDVDTIVLDDGFQHRKIARQFDLVLIDATRSPFEDRCLPAGRLREPADSLARADAVLLTHCELVADQEVEALRARLSAFIAEDRVFRSEHAWAGLEIISPDDSTREETVQVLRGRRVVALSAIGRPEPFEAGVRDAVGDSGRVERFRFRDHHPLDERSLDAVRRSCDDADALVCTAKDWAKLARRAPLGVDVVIPRLELRIREGDERRLRDLILDAADAALE